MEKIEAKKCLAKLLLTLVTPGIISSNTSYLFVFLASNMLILSVLLFFHPSILFVVLIFTSLIYLSRLTVLLVLLYNSSYCLTRLMLSYSS